MPASYITAAILLTNLLIFSVSLYWMTTSWLHLHPQPPFLPRTCTLLTANITASHNRYRNDFTVTLYRHQTDPPPLLPSVAFRYGSPTYNQSLPQATAFHRRFSVLTNYTCWIAPPGFVEPWPYLIALSHPDTTPTAKQRDMALVSTIFTSLTVFALFVQVFCTRLREPAPAFPPLPAPPARAGLDTDAIERVCAKSEGRVDCAICLEDVAAEVARLPCGHRFHRACVTRWLGRGGRCPLCNWDLAREGEACGEGQRRTTGEGSGGDVVTNASWRRLVERGSRSRSRSREVPREEGKSAAGSSGAETRLRVPEAGADAVGLRRRRSASASEEVKTETSSPP